MLRMWLTPRTWGDIERLKIASLCDGRAAMYSCLQAAVNRAIMCCSTSDAGGLYKKHCPPLDTPVSAHPLHLLSQDYWKVWSTFGPATSDSAWTMSGPRQSYDTLSPSNTLVCLSYFRAPACLSGATHAPLSTQIAPLAPCTTIRVISN